MIINGRAIANEIISELRNEVTHLSHAPHLSVITAAPSFASQKYIALKKRKAEAAGIGVSVIELPAEASTDDVIAVVARAAMQSDGVLVQLPLPSTIDTDAVLKSIPTHCDVDGVGYVDNQQTHLPPVVAAIGEIAERADVLMAGQHVVVVGHGRLVGEPAAVWAKGQGSTVSIVTKHTVDAENILTTADILILGVGQPGLITPTQLKPGVVIFDAGTSEDNGELKGDAHPDCADVASLFTPVPGGIGPITVSMLLKNVVKAAEVSANLS